MGKSNLFLSFGKSFSYYFIGLGIIFIPFNYHLFPYQKKITSFVFGKAISALKPFLFKNSKYDILSSDSSSLYVLVFILICLAIFLSIVFTFSKLKKHTDKLLQLINIIIPYYVALMLLNYGVDKLFMEQFYKPEANTLFTPLGFLDSDILFWSTIGSSPLFSFFLGFFQIITAFLLLFKKTRFIGFISALCIFTSISIINISFDISVKILSFFLLFTSIVGLFKYASLFKVINLQIQLFNEKKISVLKKTSFFYPFLKSFIILLFIFEVLYPNIIKNYQTDKYFLNLTGGYSVIETLKNNISIENPKIKRIFIHKNKYLIFQHTNDEMIDYELKIIKAKSQFIITDYNLKKTFIDYSYQDKNLVLKFNQNNKTHQITTQKIPIDSLPLLKRKFHWSIDNIQ